MSVLSVLSVKGGDTPLTDKIRKVSFGIFITQMMNNCKKRDYTEQQMLQANMYLSSPFPDAVKPVPLWLEKGDTGSLQEYQL